MVSEVTDDSPGIAWWPELGQAMEFDSFSL